jgi:hypothetical protein
VKNEISVLVNAVAKILRPFVRILVRYGLSCPELIEMIKELYVDVVDRDYQIKGKKQTVSRIATLTGLSRKEVQKIKVSLKNVNKTTIAPVNRANRVILGWLKDSEFLDNQNEPAVIPLRGERTSFECLVKRYSGDIPTKTILVELKRIGVVEELEGGYLQLITKGYVPKTEEDKINVMAKCVRDQIETIDFNLSHPLYEARFQRQIKYVDLPPELIKEFKEFSKERSIELMMEFNLWLSQRKKQLPTNTDTKATGQAGFGLYYFEKDGESDE